MASSKAGQLKIPKLFGRQVFLTPRLGLILGIVTLAAWYFIAKTFAASSAPVRFVAFCPKDSCGISTSKASSYGKEAQAFYKKQTGKTFTLEATTIKSTKSASYFWTCQSSDGCGGRKKGSLSMVWYNLSKDPKINVSGKKTIVFISFDSGSLNACGAGGGTVGVVATFSQCDRARTATHELGHTFGLSHITTVKNLMKTPPDCSLSDCKLTSAQKTKLLGQAWFAGSGGSSVSTPTGPKPKPGGCTNDFSGCD